MTTRPDQPRRRSRTSTVAILVTLLLLALPATALAAVSGSLVSPGHDAVVRSPVELRVEVTREVLDPEARSVHVRLSADGASAVPGTRTVSLSCIAGCGTRQSTWGGVLYDPATNAPFSSSPVCNGRWYLQTAVNDGAFGTGSPMVAAAPASPARSVRVAIDGRDAVLTWTPAPEPDVAAYRVERRAEGGTWRSVGRVDAGADGYVDADVDTGAYEWRVVTLRPDGREAGAGVAPCADRGADLETTSAVTRGRVTEPRPAPSPSPSPRTGDPGDADGGDDAGPGDGADGDGTGGGSGDGGGDGAPGDGSGTDPDATDGDAPDAGGDGSDDEPAAGGPRTRVGAPPSARSERLSVDADLPSDGSGAPAERYYGEDQGVGELDYGDEPPVVAQPDQGIDERNVGRWVPGGVSVFTERARDDERILRSVAGGLVSLTFGLHLRRWLRDHDADPDA